MNTNALLEWLSQLITGLVIIYVLINALKTNCFQPNDWILTAAALFFALFVQVISKYTLEK